MRKLVLGAALGLLAVTLAAPTSPTALSPPQPLEIGATGLPERELDLHGHLDMSIGHHGIPEGVTAARDRVPPDQESGGPAIAHRPGGLPVTRGRPVPVGRMYRTGFGAGEPTIGVTKDGTLFFQGLDGPPTVLRSRNGGKKWTDVSPMLGNRKRHPTTLDPYLYEDPKTDRVFSYDFYFGCSEISFTDDLGKTWTTTVFNCGEMDHQNLFAGPPVMSPTIGYENVVYTCSTQAGATIYSVSTMCLKSLDGGVTYVPTGAPPFVTQQEESNDMGISGYCHGAIGHGYVGADGTVYVPKGLCGQPWLAISRDEGATWERVQVADNGMPMTLTGVYEHEASVAADKKGNIYYFWVANDRLPYLATSKDGGKSWSKPAMVGVPRIKEATLPKLDVTPDGRVAIAYYGSTNSPGPPFPERYSCVPDAVSCLQALFFLNPPDPKRYEPVTWNGYLGMSEDALSSNPTFFTASVNDPKDPFVRGTCGPIRCKAVYDFIDVVLDKRGQPWAAYVDICIATCAEGAAGNQGNEGVVGTLLRSRG